jgi:c-di-GMP-binding flagellar brake protein YcgR
MNHDDRFNLNCAACGLPSEAQAEPGVSSLDENSRPQSALNVAALRRWRRFHVDMAVQVRVTTQGPTRVASWEGQGKDISVGGLAVIFSGDLPLGSQVGIEFTLPNTDQPMSFRGFLRNRERNRYGVEFIAENDDDYRKIGELQAILEAMNQAAHTSGRCVD